MRRLSLSSLAVLTLLSVSSPVLADKPTDTTGAGSVTAYLVTQAQATPPTVTAPAPKVPTQAEPPPPATEVEFSEVVKLVVQAATSRNWGLLACALVLATVHLVRKFLVPRVPWLGSDVAGVVLSMVTATVLTLVAALKTGTPITLALVLGAILTAAGASGLYSWGKKLTAAAKMAKASAQPTTH